MFRKTKSRSNLRHRLSSEGDQDDAPAPTSAKDSGTTQNNGAASFRTMKTDVEKVIYKEEIEERTVVVKPKPNSLLSFDDVEGDDVSDFKLKKKEKRSKRMEKLSKKAMELPGIEVEEVTVKREIEVVEQKFSPSHGDYKSTSIKEEAAIYVSDEADVTIRNKFPSTYGQIPDAQAVYEARKKRERMRLMGDDGLAPVDDVQRYKEKAGARSRLVREDDNDLSDEEEEHGCFYSSKSVLMNEEERMRSTRSDFLAAEQGDDGNDQSDEEVSRWESEQIRKGVSFHKVERMEYERARMAAAMQAMMGSFAHMSENTEQLPMEMDIDVGDTTNVDETRGRFSGQTTNVTLDDILSKLRLRIKNCCEALNTRETELESLEKNINENKETIANLEMEEPKLNERFCMYQQMRAYNRDLLECISAKIEEIKKVEGQVNAILNGRAHKFRKRRRQDIHDTYDECSAAAAGKQQAVVRSSEVMQRAAEREARRARRRRLRENTLDGISHEDGLSTDDEETNSEIVARQQALGEIREVASVIFTDVIDDYCRVGRIVARYVDWLSVDETSFTDAFIHLFIPRLLSPFIRLELLFWNPIEEENCPLYMMEWYKDLLLCAVNNADVDAEHSLLVSLIPLCIEKVVLNKITDVIEEQWDPLSEKQCKRLGFLLVSVVDECPLLDSSSRPIQRLLTVLKKRIQESIDEDLFIPIYSKQAVESSSSGCKAFLDRQFWTAIKLVRCLSYFNDILSRECLDGLILEGIANRSLSLALQCSVSNDSSMVRKCRAILKLIPEETWQKFGATSLRSLHSTLIHIAEDLKPKYRDFSKELRRTVCGER